MARSRVELSRAAAVKRNYMDIHDRRLGAVLEQQHAIMRVRNESIAAIPKLEHSRRSLVGS
jgi:hypothetical protein